MPAQHRNGMTCRGIAAAGLFAAPLRLSRLARRGSALGLRLARRKRAPILGYASLCCVVRKRPRLPLGMRAWLASCLAAKAAAPLLRNAPAPRATGLCIGLAACRQRPSPGRPAGRPRAPQRRAAPTRLGRAAGAAQGRFVFCVRARLRFAPCARLRPSASCGLFGPSRPAAASAGPRCARAAPRVSYKAPRPRPTPPRAPTRACGGLSLRPPLGGAAAAGPVACHLN